MRFEARSCSSPWSFLEIAFLSVIPLSDASACTRSGTAITLSDSTYIRQRKLWLVIFREQVVFIIVIWFHKRQYGRATQQSASYRRPERSTGRNPCHDENQGAQPRRRTRRRRNDKSDLAIYQGKADPAVSR